MKPSYRFSSASSCVYFTSVQLDENAELHYNSLLRISSELAKHPPGSGPAVW
jgi:hypothetical protein